MNIIKNIRKVKNHCASTALCIAIILSAVCLAGCTSISGKKQSDVRTEENTEAQTQEQTDLQLLAESAETEEDILPDNTDPSTEGDILSENSQDPDLQQMNGLIVDEG